MQITPSSGILPAGQHAEMESTQNFQHFGTKKPDETGGCNENAFLEAFLDLGNGLQCYSSCQPLRDEVTGN